MYESAEGGAGVLRDLVENPEALPRIARSALEICHFDPDTGADLGPAAARGFGCEAACYDCLLDYGNQMDHRNLDRKLIVELLQSLAKSTVVVGAAALSRSEQMQKLWDRCDSELERRWLKLIESKRLSLPTDGQYLITSCSTRPDFYYADAKAAVFIDGPPHDTAETKAKDIEITERLIDAGYIVIRFHHQQDWEQVFTKYRDVFGG
jgi:very-short-patch-repair endonuclease